MEGLHHSIKNLRKDYDSDRLNEDNIDKNPFEQFKNWLNLALSSDVPEPTAMTLSTVDKDNRPSSRIVLLKGVEDNGFVFYTNYDSRKGKEMLSNTYVSLNFFWHQLERQVRIDGHALKVKAEDSDEYFNSRPRESQIGAWTSLQSSPITSREVLESKYKELEQFYLNKEVPRPHNWGGFIVIPYQFEFWQGRPNRLHDRFQYKLLKDTNWLIERLSP
jgi:pyridoxamine 5'-phosphate oxidase